MENEIEMDLTPSPRILVALTHTPLTPLDALCELIDNSIDSFQTAKFQGNPIKKPLIIIDLPKLTELNNNLGCIQIRDNGPGLTREMAEKAIRAGFSGNNPYDSLGLFGMGFNISTGKMGRKTRLLTVRKEENYSLEITIDLDKITQSGSYKIPAKYIDKNENFDNGTLVEISGWWPAGTPNANFIKKLVQYGIPVIRREIGRRYATILRKNEIRIVINQENCVPFEHCIWGEDRFVERRDHGQIPAVIKFDEVLGNRVRCLSCAALIPHGDAKCPSCGSSSLRTVEERLRGWIGIQRFDSETDYGIDLIRNGRTILIFEKAAFFDFVDEFKNVTKDYPIDQIYGRIVGEVHLDHVPVDFLKQDFQRSSPEWMRAMASLRGETTLQPTKTNGIENESPVFKIYQGYRRVRSFGKTDMYMGYYNRESEKPSRISRDIEKEYYEKFKQKLPGYYDDEEWWKLVEEADKPPLDELIECPECGTQDLSSAEECITCGYIFKGKECINPECARIIPFSALLCAHCGSSQIVEVSEPWKCAVCGTKNSPGIKICNKCGNPEGTENTLSKEYLLKNSNKSDELSYPGCSILLPNGNYSSPIDVNTHVTLKPIVPNQSSERIPIVVFKSDKIDIFVDMSHPLYNLYNIKPEQLIAGEIALYIFDYNRQLAGGQYAGQFSVSNLEWKVLNQGWSERLEDNFEKVKGKIEDFFSKMKQFLPVILKESAKDIYTDLDDDQKKNLVENLINSHKDFQKLGNIIDNGEYLSYLDEKTIVNLFKLYPEKFFDGNFWAESYSNISDLDETIVLKIQKHIHFNYLNCLHDISGFISYKDPTINAIQRAHLSLKLLLEKVVLT